MEHPDFVDDEKPRDERKDKEAKENQLSEKIGLPIGANECHAQQPT